ncbi:hypothetical protein BJ508DRAFT_306540 [Ascobolus immersus RN42]|uniref:Uncharacterized protein n=1 Tax=Ascobolus immersus RN42 TaxID=1160509 RepID=A0A3N4IIM2_ASCIM|nr:hypothetical protein BJ508DRAFT_306540 [Ascobolus immersus RN42]
MTGEPENDKVPILGQEYNPWFVGPQYRSGIDFILSTVFIEVANLGKGTKLSPVEIVFSEDLLAGLRKEQEALAKVKKYHLTWTFWDEYQHPRSRKNWRFLGNRTTINLLKNDIQKYPYHELLFRALHELQIKPAVWATALAHKEDDEAAADVHIYSWTELRFMEVVFKEYVEKNIDRSNFVKEFQEELLEMGRYMARLKNQ